MRLLLRLIAAAVLLLPFAACGGDDDTEGASSSVSSSNSPAVSSESSSPESSASEAIEAPDACDLLDAAAVSAAFGTEFADGHASSATPLGADGSSCEWNTIGEAGFTLVIDGSNLQLSFDTGKETGDAVSGVCDDAYFEDTNLVAIQSGIYLHGSVNNVDDPDHEGLKAAITAACEEMA